MDLSIYILKLLLFLLLFLFVLFLFLRYGKRLKFTELKKEKNGLKRIDTLYLGYKRFLSLVEYENRFFLIGVGDKEISLLDSWTREER